MKKLLVCAGAAIFAFGVYIYKIPLFRINAPEQIVIEKGNGFEIDDYVTIEGKKGKVYVEYVDNVTFAGDIDIILKTIITVINKEGINSDTSVTMEEFMGNIK